MPQKGRKSTQRERLLKGMVDVANLGGYASANVSAVIERAGVSRPTFYDYFSDRDDCFLGTILDTQQRLLERVQEAVGQAPGERAMASAAEALVAFASAEPGGARFVMGEAMAGGVRALDARDEGIARIASLVQDQEESVDGDASVPDVERRTVVGGIYRLLATRLRRGEPGISKLVDQTLEWVASYERPAGEQRWRELAPAPARGPRRRTASRRSPRTRHSPGG